MKGRDIHVPTIQRANVPNGRVLRFVLALYPRAWRARYGDELVALVEERPLTARGWMDLFSGAIDARFEPLPPAGSERSGGTMPTVFRRACFNEPFRYTTGNALKSAAAMLIASALFSAAGIGAKRLGWPESGEGILSMAFPVSILLSSHFLFLSEQSRRAKWIITGGTLVFLTIITILATWL